MWCKGVVVHLLGSGGVWCSSYTMVAGVCSIIPHPSSA